MLTDAVPPLLHEAAQRFILPRFRALQHGDVEEKSPGEVVTVADREAEAWLAPALQSLVPGSRVVGEEACAAEPRLLHALDEGDVWLVDPLDGTGNFIAGRDDFAVMVALLRGGEPVAAWMHMPVAASTYGAERGAGAWCNGERMAAAPRSGGLRGIVKTRFLPPGVKESVTARAAGLREVLPGANCTAADYPAIVLGRADFALYWRTLPWDHAPGALLLEEAGGIVARLDGSRYRPAQELPGLLAAADRETWQQAHALLF